MTEMLFILISFLIIIFCTILICIQIYRFVTKKAMYNVRLIFTVAIVIVEALQIPLLIKFNMNYLEHIIFIMFFTIYIFAVLKEKKMSEIK